MPGAVVMVPPAARRCWFYRMAAPQPIGRALKRRPSLRWPQADADYLLAACRRPAEAEGHARWVGAAAGERRHCNRLAAATAAAAAVDWAVGGVRRRCCARLSGKRRPQRWAWARQQPCGRRPHLALRAASDHCWSAGTAKGRTRDPLHLAATSKPGAPRSGIALQATLGSHRRRGEASRHRPALRSLALGALQPLSPPVLCIIQIRR